MKKMKENNGFLITCVACILLLMFMCYFGVNSSSVLKGTRAEVLNEHGCPLSAPNVMGNNYCCPNDYTSAIVPIGGTTYCVSAASHSLQSENGDLVCDTMIFGEESAQSYINDGWECEPYYQDTSLGPSYTYHCTKSNEEVGCAVEAIPRENMGTDGKSCWQCNNDTNLLYWGNSGTNSGYSCPAGWHAYNVSENECKTNDLVSYTATLNANGGTLSDGNSVICEGRANSCYVDLPTPSFSGHTFLGWATSTSACSSAGKGTVQLTGDITYVACWTANVPTTTMTCKAGEYYSGQGNCKECPANSWCPGGTFDNRDDRAGVNECPANRTSPKGSDEEKDCVPIEFKANFLATEVGYIRDDSCSLKNGGDSCTVKAAAEPTVNVYDGKNFCGWRRHDQTCSSVVKPGVTLTLSESVDTDLNDTIVGGQVNYYACWAVSCDSSSGAGDGGGDYSEPSSEPSSDSSSESSSEFSSSNPNLESGDNPDTGEIAIAITWFMGLFAIAYSVYYFKKVKEN